MYNDLKGRVAVITGAGRELGMGQAIARRFATEGVSVVVSDIGRKFEEVPDYELGTVDYLQSLVEDIRSNGGNAIAVRADVTKSDEVKLMIETAISEFKQVDILVNNAGASPGAALVADMEEWAWDITTDVIAKGAYLCCKHAIPHIIAGGRGGRIINISSISGKTGFPYIAAYNVAKAGVILLTQTLARELGAEGITVNAICPGNIETLMGREEIRKIAQTRGISEEQARQGMIAETALDRLGTAEDISNAVTFLASDQASYITGQSINVCGGIEFH